MGHPSSTVSIPGFAIWIAMTLEVSCSAGAVQSPTVSAPPKWTMVPPRMLVEARASGEDEIEPDDATKIELARTGRNATGTFRLCLDESGAIVFVRAVSATRVPSYDRKIVDEIRRWRFRPYPIEGKARTVCSDIAVTYSPPGNAPPAGAPPPSAAAASQPPGPEPSPGAAPARPDESDSDEETRLSARRWVYATFFNRLKRSIVQKWNPQAIWNALGSARTGPLGAAPRTTVVRIGLSPDGQLATTVIVTSSGVVELDNEALRAVRAAAPFSTPPEGLVKNGRIELALSFDFEVGDGMWRVLWRASPN